MRHFLRYNLLLRGCKTIQELKRLHSRLIILGLHRDQHLLCKTLTLYSRSGHVDDALKVFEEMSQPDLISWTCMISSCISNNRHELGFEFFLQMLLSGMKPDEFTIVGVLSSCGRIRDLGYGKMIHGMIHRFGVNVDVFVYNALIDMYSRNGKMDTARTIFSKMPMRNVVSWTSLIDGYVRCKDIDAACFFFDQMPERNAVSWTSMITGYVLDQPIRTLHLFHDMRLTGVAPTEVTIVAVISACCNMGALELGQCLHSYVYKTRLDFDVVVENSLIDMYAKCGSLELASRVFSVMVHRDVFSWTTMINAFAIHGRATSAIGVLMEMLDSRIEPNSVTFVAVLSACSHGGLVDEARQWFGCMKEFFGVTPKIEHYGCLADVLGRSGLLGEARRLIEDMEGDAPDTTIWKSLAGAALIHGDLEMAEFAGNKIISLDPNDDGAHVLLSNLYAAANKMEKAAKIRRLMKDKSIIKEPACSWIEISGIVHEFLIGDTMHPCFEEVYQVAELMAKQLDLN